MTLKLDKTGAHHPLMPYLFGNIEFIISPMADGHVLFGIKMADRLFTQNPHIILAAFVKAIMGAIGQVPD